MKTVYLMSFCLTALVFFAGLDSTYAYKGEKGTPGKKTERVKYQNASKLTRGPKLLSVAKVSQSKRDVIKAYIQRSKRCVEANTDTCQPVSRDCRESYCNDQECVKKIVCCHTIDRDTFNRMIDGGHGFAEFSVDQFERVAAAAVCPTNMIRFGKIKPWFLSPVYYRITCVPANAEPDEDYDIQVYYSTPLIKGILEEHKNNIQSIIVYTGFVDETVDEQSVRRAIIPFEVKLVGGGSIYYDVSDTHP